MEIEHLPALTKSMYEVFKNWSDRNWLSTLESHRHKTEELLEKIKIFDIWANALQDSEVARKLIPEIFVDAYMSIHFACMGLYKYAFMCLRSQLETVLRMVFFSTHPVEFQWWLAENEWYRSGLKTRDVWGEGYLYFGNLEHVKKFERQINEEKRLFVEGKRISKIHKNLSKYVHTSASSFQTTTDTFSPIYKIDEFNRWVTIFKEIQQHTNTILVLGFLENFKMLGNTEKKQIIEKAIEDRDYIEKLKEAVGVEE